MAQGYDDGSLYSSHYAPGQGQMGNETYQSPGPGTPSRGGRSRPSQPPPAPPSNASSNSTPTVASANNTPTRGRSMSTGRDTLPPPPPPPGEVMSPPPINGTIPAHLLNRNGSRSNSPLPSHQSTPTPPNHTLPVGIDEPDPAPQDLPPPPPTPDPAPSRPISPPCNIPPPPPPPPPPPVLNGPMTCVPISNGDIAKIIANNPPKLKPLKSIVDGQLRKPQNPNIPIVDPRNDLLKAIRDGKDPLIIYLRNYSLVEAPMERLSNVVSKIKTSSPQGLKKKKSKFKLRNLKNHLRYFL